MKPLTLRRNFSWTFLGNAVYAACQWGMLVVIAKLGSPEMVGEFTLGLAITAPVFMFSSLQLRTVQATDAKQEYRFEDYFGLRLLTSTIAILVILGITLTANYQWETSAIVIVFAFAKAVESIIDIFQGVGQQQERMDRLAISALIRGPLSLLLLGTGIYITHSIFWGTVGLLVAWVIVLLSYDIHTGSLAFRKADSTLSHQLSRVESLALLKPRWQIHKLKKLVWLALPLGFVMMLISLNTNIPRYFIEQYLGKRELGFFAAISSLMVATGMVISALGQSASPRLAKYYAEGNRTAFRTLLLKLIGVGFTLGVLGVLVVVIAGKQILSIFYSPEYAEYNDLFLLLMITTAIADVSAFLGYGMTAARYFSLQMPLFLVVTSSSALACFGLIPKMGLRGAAIALLIGAGTQFLLSIAVNLHALYKLPKHYEEYP